MTREEAIAFGKRVIELGFKDETAEFCEMAISALEKNESAEEWYKLLCEKWDSAENNGEWIMPIQDDGMSDPIYYQVRCSKCGFDLDPQTWHQELHQYGADNFCPNCGADMRGKADEENIN